MKCLPVFGNCDCCGRETGMIWTYICTPCWYDKKLCPHCGKELEK